MNTGKTLCEIFAPSMNTPTTDGLPEVIFPETPLHDEKLSVTYATGDCGKYRAFVCIREGRVAVCSNSIKFAENFPSIWRRSMGRSFNTVAQALAAYKRPEVQKIVRAVAAKHREHFPNTTQDF